MITQNFTVLVYIAPASSNGAGAVWTKIFHAGNDGTWAVDKLLSTRGQHSITIPDIPAGNYLIRGKHPSVFFARKKFTAP